MAKLWFATTVVLKIVMWAVMWGAIAYAVWSLFHGHVGLGIAVLVIGIPLLLWGASLVLGILQMVILIPIASLLGKRQQYFELANFQVAISEHVPGNRMTLRMGRETLRMFERLPPPEPGEGTRSGEYLLALYEDIAWHDEADELTAGLDGLDTPPQPTNG